MDTQVLEYHAQRHHSPPENQEAPTAFDVPFDDINEPKEDRLEESDDLPHSILVNSSRHCSHSTTDTIFFEGNMG